MVINLFCIMKPFLLLLVSTLIIIIISLIGSFNQSTNEQSEQRLELELREIGHRLLLSTNDSTSRVLPIAKLNPETYQISFESSFSFNVDTLVRLFENQFQNNPLRPSYRVNVRNCTQKETVYAFEINNQDGSLTPCNGRKLPMDCYMIQTTFIDTNSINYAWFLLLIIPLGVFGMYMRKKTRKNNSLPMEEEQEDFIRLGNFKFYPTKSLLTIENQQIELAAKEVKALLLFSENINQIIDRDVLMAEIWEKEGFVVISRNVDVLVSKLRKKLAEDESIKIMNVHGKGYKFIVE